jgi:hypothetical protein
VSLAAMLVLAASALARADAGVEPEGAAVESAAHALIEHWLQAQNERQLQRYLDLYAPAFTGVRRSGTKTVTMDRAAWARDRERMFKARMSVNAEDIRVTPAAGGADVTLTQSFASETYSDVGQKVMRLVREGGGWRIAREELLSSTVVPPPAPLPPFQAPMVVPGCPGEYCGCITSRRLRAAVALREKPDPKSRIVKSVKAGARIESAEMLTVVRDARPSWRLTDGRRERVYHLGYAAEGQCEIYDGRSLDQASCDELDDKAEASAETWVRIRTGGVEGYTSDPAAVEHGSPQGCSFGE